MSDRKLLLADDSLTIQKVVNLTFADEGIEVVCASSGEAAMSKLSEFVPDLVLADVNMPGPNGYKICEIIRQREETRAVPVILLVGSFEPFDEAEFRRVGANDYLTKPFQSIRHLVTRVSELLDEKAASSADKDLDPALRGDSAADEDEDIDDLYRQSFTETIELPQAAPSLAHLGDPGMDDELIETQIVEPPSESKLEGFDFSMPADVIEENDYAEFSLVDETAGEAESDAEPVFFAGEDLSEAAATRESAEPSDTTTEVEVGSPNVQGEIEDVPFPESQPEYSEPLEVAESSTEVSLASTEDVATEPLEVAGERSDPLEIPFSEEVNAAETQTDVEILDSHSDEPANEDIHDPLEDPAPEISMPSPTSASLADTGNGAAAMPAVEEEPISSQELSPEMIEVIANKVIERISDRVIRRIAWQIVPEIVESVARDYVEKDQKI